MYSAKRSYKKFAVFILILVFFSNSYGCFSEKHAVRLSEYIDESTEWYSCETTTVDDSNAGNIDNSFPVFADSKCKIIYQFYDESNEFCGKLSYIEDSNVAVNIDLNDNIEDCELIELKTCYCKNDAYYAVIFCVKEGEFYNYAYKINVESGTLEFVFELDRNLKDTRYYVNKAISFNELLYVQVCYLDGNYYKNAFYILDNQYNVVDGFDYSEDVMQWTIDEEGKIVVIKTSRSSYDDSDRSAVKLDVNSGALTQLSISSDVLSKYGLGYISEDGNYYSLNKDLTLSKLNLLTGEESLIVDFNNSEISLFDLDGSVLLYCDDLNIELVKNTFYPSEPLEWKFYSLTREETNPNIGKKILYAAPYFKINSLAANAIKLMNESDESTYIYVTMRYSSVLFEDYEINDNYVINQYNRDIALITLLKQDIRNGEGPDVLLDFGKFSTLNSSDYLNDLLFVINDTNRFNREEYFDNIFDAYTKDNKLFQLPVSACIGGIYTDESITDVNHVGVTYEEYNEYITNSCNGYDPLEESLGRDRSFSILIRSCYDDLYVNNKLNLDNNSFRCLCSYVSGMRENPSVGDINNEISFVEFNRIHFDLSRLLIKENRNLFGFPSVNGDKGPVVFPYESVAITSCSGQFDSAFDLVKNILSYEIQITNVTYNPINKSAFEYYANDALNYANSYIEEMFGIVNYNDESVIDEYIEYISSANTCYLGDDYSLLIMNEELQAYYYDQKSLDDVIPIIESRVNNMMEENY